MTYELPLYSYLNAIFPEKLASVVRVAQELGIPQEVVYPVASFGLGIFVGLWIAKWRARWSEPVRAERQQRSSLIQAVMAVREDLLGYSAVNPQRVEVELDSLESSRLPLWIDQKARAARRDFLHYARAALDVRRTRDDYRNNIERWETKTILEDAENRLKAALSSKAIPPAFNPYGDEPDTWLRRMWQRQRLWRSIKRYWRGMRGKR